MAGFPYEIYYFSRNMEHVLHDRAENLTDDEKEDLAFDIADQYTDQLEKFLEYLHDWCAVPKLWIQAVQFPFL